MLSAASCAACSSSTSSMSSSAVNAFSDTPDSVFVIVSADFSFVIVRVRIVSRKSVTASANSFSSRLYVQK